MVNFNVSKATEYKTNQTERQLYGTLSSLCFEFTNQFKPTYT